MVNHPWEYHLDTFPHSPYMILQTCTSHHKIVSIGVVFFSYNSSFLFSSHTLAWACIIHLKFQSLLVSFISQSLLNRFQYNLYYCLPYSCSTSRAIFSFILSSKVISEHTLHSRVKYSIAHNLLSQLSFVHQILREVCYTNVYSDSTFLCKSIILIYDLC